ncbi:MAG: hypothetical protein J6K20_08955 [Thermoguttaceae bacterium]|nr:hypothetical protein [Thermoguttaceae bacterium]
MLEFLCYLASQTLRGSFYIVFMLTLQRLLRDRLSPRVRAALWAPLLIALLAPQLCVVRVPVSQPVETTVVDALEQTRVVLTSDLVKPKPDFGVYRVDGRTTVYVPPSPLETGPFKTVAPPFADAEPFPQEIGDDNWAESSGDEVEPTFADVAALPEPTPETPQPTFAEFFEQPLEESTEIAAEPTSAPLEESPEIVAAPLSLPASPTPQVADVRSGWFEFFEAASLVSVAIWALGLVCALVYLVRSALVCRRWVRLSAPVDDADVLTLYRRCADSLEIAAPPRLATTTDLSSPALLGWRRAVVLVPSEYVDGLSEERLTHVLLHELGHFKRGDAATGFLAFFVLATHWFNPLFWLAARSFHATREEACDALALGSSALTSPNSAAEYARTLCEIAGRRPFVEQAFGAVGFSPTFRSLRRRVETLALFGTWGRRAAIGCLVASLAASAFATVRLRPDVEKDAASIATVADENNETPDAAFASVKISTLRRVLVDLGPLPEPSLVAALEATDPLASVDVVALYDDPADRLFFGHSLEERRAFVVGTVAKFRAARERGEAEYLAALGDYLIRESPFFWLLAGLEEPFRDEPVVKEKPFDLVKVPFPNVETALARAEQTSDPNFRFLAKLHRALLDETNPGGRDESLYAYVRSPYWRSQGAARPCRGFYRELQKGIEFLAEAAAQGNGDAAASLARYIENLSLIPGPRGYVAEVAQEAKASIKYAEPGAPTYAFQYAFAGAKAGSPRAQALVASYFARGYGVERNLAEALRWGRIFYDADVANNAELYLPPAVFLEPQTDGATDAKRFSAKSLPQLSELEAREFRRLADVVETSLGCTPEEASAAPLSRRVFLEGGACDLNRGPRKNAGPKSWATHLLLTEAALDSEPTPENLALAERFLRRANAFESRSFFELVPDSQFPTESRVALDDQKIRVTPGIVEANERLARIFASGAFGVKDDAKANEFRRFAQEFAADYATATQTTFFDEPTVDARRSFVAPQTPEFEATIAPIFAKLEKTLVDAKNGNAAALTARFDEYFDDATDLYPNGRSGSPEVARYKVERLTREIERLEQTDADAETLERLRQTRDSWRRLAAETPVVATSA